MCLLSPNYLSAILSVRKEAEKKNWKNKNNFNSRFLLKGLIRWRELQSFDADSVRARVDAASLKISVKVCKKQNFLEKMKLFLFCN